MPLNATAQDIRITENYTYVYFMPEDLSFYSITLTFCLKDKLPTNYVNEIYSALKVLMGNSLQIISKIKSCLLWSSEIIVVWLKNQGIFGIRERSMARYPKSLWE